jgi:hypothetical protein
VSFKNKKDMMKSLSLDGKKLNKNILKIEREEEQINNILKDMDNEYHVIHGQIVS